MSISRDSVHKRRKTGGKQKPWRKKRKFQLGRPPALTKLGAKRIHLVRGRGGNLKHRAIRLEQGNFSWGSEAVARKTRVLVVVYNASNNEFVRTNTLVKNSIIQIDSTPFRQFYEQKYGIQLGKKKKEKTTKDDTTAAAVTPATTEKKRSRHVLAKIKGRKATSQIDPHLEEQFTTGRLYAVISSHPGQSGRADGYILEGKELDFYLKKLQKKKEKKEKV